MMVDSDHAGYEADRRYRTSYMIYLQISLIDWLSKKQATVEKDVFGYEFFAMKHGVETCRNLLSIDSRLNRIDPSTNIFPQNPERGYRTKFKILLEEVFPNSIE